jgi:hypothetical protein
MSNPRKKAIRRQGISLPQWMMTAVQAIVDRDPVLNGNVSAYFRGLVDRDLTQRKTVKS